MSTRSLLGLLLLASLIWSGRVGAVRQVHPLLQAQLHAEQGEAPVEYNAVPSYEGITRNFGGGLDEAAIDANATPSGLFRRGLSEDGR